MRGLSINYLSVRSQNFFPFLKSSWQLTLNITDPIIRKKNYANVSKFSNRKFFERLKSVPCRGRNTRSWLNKCILRTQINS